MTLTNELHRVLESGATGPGLRDAAERLVLMLAPVAPHLAEELWRETLGHPTTVTWGPWPTYDEELARSESVTLVAQVDGKVRDLIEVPAGLSEDECRQIALRSEKVRRFLDGREVARVIVRAPKLVNVVTRG